MTTDCEHPLCTIIGGACSLATRRSRGCRTTPTAKDIAPELFDELRQLLTVIKPDDRSEAVRVAAVRVAAIVRREALDNRNLLVIASAEEPELARVLVPLCRRR